MSSTVDLTLRLTPIRQPAAPAVKPAADDWLENNDADLLSSVEAKAKTDTGNANIADVLSSIADDDDTRILHVNHIEIKQTNDHFMLATDNGPVALQNGDVIAVGETPLKVSIHKETIVAYEGPARKPETDYASPDANDIWSAANANTNNRFSDPFASNSPYPLHTPASTTQSNVTADPLGFLYGSSAQQPSQVNNLLPGTSVLPGNISGFSHTLPYDQVPTTNMHIPSMPLPGNSGLNVDTQQHYTPTHMSEPQDQRYRQGRAETPVGADGNILRDLGINEQHNATIVNRDYTQGSHPFTEQSPMDMLDEYLSDDSAVAPQTMPQPQYHYPAPVIPAVPHTPATAGKTTDVVHSLKNVFKKIIG